MNNKLKATLYTLATMGVPAIAVLLLFNYPLESLLIACTAIVVYLCHGLYHVWLDKFESEKNKNNG